MTVLDGRKIIARLRDDGPNYELLLRDGSSTWLKKSDILRIERIALATAAAASQPVPAAPTTKPAVQAEAEPATRPAIAPPASQPAADRYRVTLKDGRRLLVQVKDQGTSYLLTPATGSPIWVLKSDVSWLEKAPADRSAAAEGPSYTKWNAQPSVRTDGTPATRPASQ